MRGAETNEEAMTLALAALGWIVTDMTRANRLLDLTGLTPVDLRARAGDADVLAAVLGFLAAHEPDLIACAEAIDCKPAALIAAHARLEIE